MKKRKHKVVKTRTNLLVDVKGKEYLTVTKGKADITPLDYEKELEKLQASLAKIQEQQYSKNYILSRVYSRTFKDIVHIKIIQILGSIEKSTNSRVANKTHYDI